MILINDTPPRDPSALEIIYARTPREGLVHSTLMHGERYDVATRFEDDWACASITWSVGGEEDYCFAPQRTIRVRKAGALTLARGERYAYAASDATPFRSNMISFPHWITDAADQSLHTRLLLPDAPTQALMNTIAAQCARGASDASWYAEHVALLFQALLDAQGPANEAPTRTTRLALKQRIERARQLTLECFSDAALDLDDIAAAACLSRFHLIRTFKALLGVTPMQYLANVRMNAAVRLLQHTAWPVAEIAAAVGFRDRTAFSRAFRRAHGAPPSAIERPR